MILCTDCNGRGWEGGVVLRGHTHKNSLQRSGQDSPDSWVAAHGSFTEEGKTMQDNLAWKPPMRTRNELPLSCLTDTFMTCYHVKFSIFIESNFMLGITYDHTLTVPFLTGLAFFLSFFWIPFIPFLFLICYGFHFKGWIQL